MTDEADSERTATMVQAHGSTERRAVRDERDREERERAVVSVQSNDPTEILGQLFEAHLGPILVTLAHVADEVGNVAASNREIKRQLIAMAATVAVANVKLREITVALNVIRLDVASVKERVSALEDAQQAQWRQIQSLFSAVPEAKGDGDGDDTKRREAAGTTKAEEDAAKEGA